MRLFEWTAAVIQTFRIPPTQTRTLVPVIFICFFN